jgi:dihydrofolate reductase
MFLSLAEVKFIELEFTIADKIELTRIFGIFDADVFFPEIDPNQWELQEEEFHSKDENHQYDFSYQTFIRK